MLRLLTVTTALLLTLSFNSQDEKEWSSPSPEGDTKMGADVARTGTNIDDKDLQKQEDKNRNQNDQTNPKQREARKILPNIKSE